MTTEIDVTEVNTDVCPRLISSTPIESTPTTTPDQIGVFVRGETRARTWENGSRPSRAIENITRVADAAIASAAEKIEIATTPSTIRPSTSPSWEVTTQAMPVLESYVRAYAENPVIVSPDAGRIKVAGRRPQDVQSLIENELAGKAIQPQVLVSVTKPISQAVTVTGEVTNGARVPLSGRGDRLLDVVASAGGVRAPVSETFVRLSRGAATATLPLTTVVSNPRENIYLRPGDVLTLVRDPQTFLAVGALGNSTELPFQAEGITLAQALAKSRGLSDFQADPAGTFVFRYEPAAVVRKLNPGSPLLGTPLVPVVYRINMRDPNSLFLTQAFRMRNRDLVYVSNAPFTDVQKVLGVVSSVAGPIGSAASVYAYTR